MKKSLMAFLDMVLNLLLILLCMFILVLAAIKEEAKTPKEAQISTQSKLVLTMDWRDDVDTDVDLWVMSPTGELLYFQNKNITFASLERDDVGEAKDRSRVNGVEIGANKNHEVVNFRDLVPGVYTVNAHYFGFKEQRRVVDKTETVTMRLIQVLPEFKEIVTVTHKMDPYRERTFFRFTVDQQGNIVGIDEQQKALVPLKK